MWELKKELEERKENLIYVLKNKKEYIELEKQHQMYGAIKELDHVIQMVENFNQPQTSRIITSGGEEDEEEVVSKSLENKNILHKVGEKVRKLKTFKIRFAKNDV